MIQAQADYQTLRQSRTRSPPPLQPRTRIYARGAQSPLTEFFVWPRRDAWDELRVALEAKPWITDRDRIVLLNRLTEVINFWQESVGAWRGPRRRPAGLAHVCALLLSPLFSAA